MPPENPPLVQESTVPERGSRWRNPDYGVGTWTVRTVGWKWVTLAPPYLMHGYPNAASVLRAAWPDGWVPAEPDLMAALEASLRRSA